MRPWCLLSRFHFSGCLLIDTIEVEHCDLLMLLLLSCEECGMDNCAWSARIRQQRWRYQRPSVSVLNWPHSTAFDGSLYGNLHLIMNIKKKAFSRSTEDCNYTVSVPSEASVLPPAPARAGVLFFSHKCLIDSTFSCGDPSQKWVMTAVFVPMCRHERATGPQS